MKLFPGWIGVFVLAVAARAEEPAMTMKAVKGKGFPKLAAETATYAIKTDVDANTLWQVATILEDLHRGFVTEFKDQVKADGKSAGKERLQVRFYKTQKSFSAGMAAAMPPGMGPGGPGGGPPGGGPGGFYDPGSRTLHTCLEQPGGDDWKFVLGHEGTHQLLHNRLGIGGGQPGMSSAIWFNEGFASYWAMSFWKGKELVTGGVQKKLLDEFKSMKSSKSLLKLKDLIGGAPNPMAMRAYYSMGWALCHFLRHSAHREKFAAYLEKERDGKISWEEFKGAFGIEDEAKFEKEFVKHVMSLK
ncbi:MAG: DUF1570 domain-containing protein [Planctomycetes bacterium]|nr:DUF1570 domain-containing protein [Planctomycetota bacterium]